MAECAVLTLGGKDGVLLKFSRPLTVLVATGTAAITIGLSAAPASADQVRSAEWWLGSLGVTSVWPASQGAGVTVAVLSDGVVKSQPDLAGAVMTAPSIPAAPVAATQFFGQQGTAIASLIAGRGHGTGGASGIIGVAPQARILSVPVTLPPNDFQLGSPTVAATIPAAIAAGIKLAVNKGASVIDLPADPGQPDSTGAGGAAAAAGGSKAEQAAVSYALAHNVVLVAPAGDNSLTTDAINYPAAYPGVIAVGAFDSAIDKAPWTSHRNYVTLTAAGSGVMAATNAGGYQPMNSTAAASAVVTGVVALIRARYPALSVADIRKALTTTTSFRRPKGLTDGSGYGALNAAKAFSVAAALGTPAKAPAGAGAQPRVTPRPAAAGAGAQSLTSQILRAGEISAGVLVLLLLVVTGYARVGRRRRTSRLPAAMAAQWTAGHTQSRYPHAPLTDADRMLELFAAPVASPDRAHALEPPALPATAGRPDDLWQADGDLFAAPLPADEQPLSTPSGPASRAVSSRAVVAGTPPWEPAAQPEGDLPWSDAPTPQTVAGEVVASGYPPAGPPPRENGPEPATIRPSRPLRADRASSARHAAEEQARQEPDEALPRWADPAYQPDQAGGFADASGQHRSGLPIRQPRPATRAPLSPSGSLWERAEPATDAGPADSTDTSRRNGFAWDQARSESSR
ncbi:MAG TPA: S8 family serine peptidase [Streptosporangiaceae bacterium]|nr:S8 family serine peptidase [Streptosporangiaceae bacterium]